MIRPRGPLMDYHASQQKLSLLRKLRRTINGLGKRHTCCICGHHFFRFSKFRGGWASYSAYLHEQKWISSDFDLFWCPFCKSHDRERHLFLYFNALHLWGRFHQATVLHLAPEKWLSHKIESLAPSLYIKGDLFPSQQGVKKIDVTRIPYSDNSFDCILCNHVLEHVPNDRRAIRELFRVLRPGGFAILQTPFAAKLKTTRENEPDILASEQKCIEFYGQEDHVRLYGTDIFDRLQKTGFIIDRKEHQEVLPNINAFRYGVNSQEPLFLCTKKSLP